MVQKWPVKFVLGSNGAMLATLRPLPTFASLFSLQILSNHVQQSAMEANVGSEEINHPHKMLLYFRDLALLCKE
jgi:hypothetical protein